MLYNLGKLFKINVLINYWHPLNKICNGKTNYIPIRIKSSKQLEIALKKPKTK